MGARFRENFIRPSKIKIELIGARLQPSSQLFYFQEFHTLKKQKSRKIIADQRVQLLRKLRKTVMELYIKTSHFVPQKK